MHYSHNYLKLAPVDEKVSTEELIEAIKSACGKLLFGVKLFDIYRSSNLGEGKKSMACHEYSLLMDWKKNHKHIFYIHLCILQTFLLLRHCPNISSFSCVVKFAPLSKNGQVDYLELEKLLTPKTRLISLMHVSNETGAINDIKKVGKLKKHVPNLCANCHELQDYYFQLHRLWKLYHLS